MKLVIKQEDEIVNTNNLEITGEGNSFKIKEHEYGDRLEIYPRERPFKIVIGDLILDFTSHKLIVSRELDEFTCEYLIQDRDTRKVYWGSDPHVSQFTSKTDITKRKKIMGKNFKKNKDYKPENLKTEKYEIPELSSEYFMINY